MPTKSSSIILFSIVFAVIFKILYARPTAVIVVFYASVGLYNTGIHDDQLAMLWKSNLEIKSKDPSWPLNSVIELVDTKSNDTFLLNWAANRVANTSLPPVSLFIFNAQGINLQNYFVQYEIPCYVCIRYPNVYSQNLSVGEEFKYTIFNTEPPQLLLTNLAKIYKDVGAKTLVYIHDSSSPFTSGYVHRNDGSLYDLNEDFCRYGATQLMEPNGIKLIGKFTYSTLTATRADRIKVVQDVQKLNPDIVLLCDSAAVFFPNAYSDWSLTIFKELNYLPKALNIVNTLGNRLANTYINTGLLEYVTQASYSHLDLSGVDYTESDTPYSSYFLADHPKDVPGFILSGSNIGNHNSSARQYLNWYKQRFGHWPSNHGVAVWSAYEVIESAMWKAASGNTTSVDGYISPDTMFQYVLNTNQPTPMGRVAFNPISHTNIGLKPVIVQVFDISNSLIIAPGGYATHEFVYPMPTWDERIYHWKLLQPSTNACIGIASASSVLLSAMITTIAIFRNNSDVKMLHHVHVIAMMLASLMVLWALVFVWQGDVTQSQCDGLLWTIYLPGSFVIQMINMKAYRLSVFLTNENPLVLKRFTHNRVLAMTCVCVAFTAFFLLIAAVVDPPTKSTIVLDKYRPSRNYNVCNIGSVTSGILYFLFCVHIVMSAVCVIVVRNGSEAFKDGLYMKESFILLFASIIVTYIFGNLGLAPQTYYLIRTAFVGLGFTLFNFRLLFSRCIMRWLPMFVKISLVKVYTHIESYIPTPNPSSKVHSMSSADLLNEDLKAIRGDLELGVTPVSEMHEVFVNPGRLQLLKSIAAEGHVEENVEFIEALTNLTQKYEESIVSSSHHASAALLEVAVEVYEKFCKDGAEKEVNISYSMREKLRAVIRQWPFDKPVVSEKTAKIILNEDLLGISHAFDAAGYEIRSVLHQNIWAKFRAKETELRMG